MKGTSERSEFGVCLSGSDVRFVCDCLGAFSNPWIGAECGFQFDDGLRLSDGIHTEGFVPSTAPGVPLHQLGETGPALPNA